MKIIYFFTALFIVSPAIAEERAFQCDSELEKDKSQAVLQRFERQFERLEDLSGRFEQESSLAGSLPHKSQGDFAFKKPGKMRWDYRKPDELLYVSNGKKFLQYEPALATAHEAEFDQAFQSDLPVAFLLGLGSISEKFKIQKSCQVGSDTWFELKPLAEDASIKAFFLRIRGKTLAPAVARVVEFGSNETTIHLSNLRKNVGLPDADFEFEIPDGVDRIPVE